MKRGPATCLSGEMAYDAMLEMERSDASSFVSIMIIIPFFLVIWNLFNLFFYLGRKKRVKELPVVDHEGRIKGLVLLHDVVEFGL